MKKVLVIGPSGAGKSFFSKELHAITKLPLYHLDNIFWNKDKTHIDKALFDVKLKEILEFNEWIIDGDYQRTCEMRMGYSDTIFFLDYPLELCLRSAKNRVGKMRTDIPWVEETFDPEFEEWIINWFKDKRPNLLSLLDKYSNTNEIIIFKTREEASKYLDKLKVKA